MKRLPRLAAWSFACRRRSYRPDRPRRLSPGLRRLAAGAANLERDAGTGGAAQVAQADRAGAAVVSFEATRAAYLKSLGQDAAQRRQILQTAATRSSPDLTPPAVADLAAAELQTVTRAIAKFATDKDPAIQQLRLSMERERVALAALSDTIQARQKTVAATSEAAAALEQARAKPRGHSATRLRSFPRLWRRWKWKAQPGPIIMTSWPGDSNCQRAAAGHSVTHRRAADRFGPSRFPWLAT